MATEGELESRYRRYIDCLNAQRWDDLGEFVRDTVVYNGKEKTLAEYGQMLAGDFDAIPDLHFDIHLLLVDEDHVACRLNFHCTPQKPFLGLWPNGKTISFSENVFYRFVGGKIAEVWSIIDKGSIEIQLAR
jgi:predicted ester cyclase